MDDTASTATSVDDKTDDFPDSPTRDALADGLTSLFRPAVEQLDERVKQTRLSQMELRRQIDSLAEDLRKISEFNHSMIELESYVKKLMNAKRRVMLVNNILQNAQERLSKLHVNVTREMSKRKALMENVPSPGITPS